LKDEILIEKRCGKQATRGKEQYKPSLNSLPYACCLCNKTVYFIANNFWKLCGLEEIILSS
jgi:hypothetical protein